MKIGILGAGFVGRTVGKKGIEAGHDVMLSNSRGPETLMSTAGAIGCKVGTADEAIAFGDVIVIAIPLFDYKSLPATSLAGKIVIDAANYYFERDGHIEALDRGETTTSEMMAAHLKGARLVKAFNSVRMVDLDGAARPEASPERVALPLAGDDAEAKALVTDLYNQFGYDTVDAGPLAEGWRFERNRPTYCILMPKEKLAEALAATTRSSWQGQ